MRGNSRAWTHACCARRLHKARLVFQQKIANTVCIIESIRGNKGDRCRDVLDFFETSRVLPIIDL